MIKITRKIPVSAMSLKTMLYILMIMGSLFFCIGMVISLIPIYKKQISTSVSTAEVVDIVRNESKDSDGRTQINYFPVFVYKANGENIQVTHRFSPSPYEIGDTFEIFYNPKKPNKYYIEGEGSGNWILVMIGSIFTFVGAIFLIVTVKFFLLPFLKAKSRESSI